MRCSALRNVLVAASATVRAFDKRVLSACDRAAGRLGLADPGVCACWLALLTAAALGVVWFMYAPLLEAVTRDVSTAPSELLRELSPAREKDPIYYRMALALTGAASITLWYLLARTTRARSQRLPAWFVPAQLSILVLLYASMQLPYRLANDSDEFGVVDMAGATVQCARHERADEALLFCPALQPRRRLVNIARDPLPPVGEPDAYLCRVRSQVPLVPLRGESVLHAPIDPGPRAVCPVSCPDACVSARVFLEVAG